MTFEVLPSPASATNQACPGWKGKDGKDGKGKGKEKGKDKNGKGKDFRKA